MSDLTIDLEVRAVLRTPTEGSEGMTEELVLQRSGRSASFFLIPNGGRSLHFVLRICKECSRSHVCGDSGCCIRQDCKSLDVT